jgi:hypothetical protein
MEDSPVLIHLCFHPFERVSSKYFKIHPYAHFTDSREFPSNWLLGNKTLYNDVFITNKQKFYVFPSLNYVDGFSTKSLRQTACVPTLALALAL